MLILYIEEETLKEIFGDIRKLTKARLMANDDISLLCGCDNLAYESFLNGVGG